MGFSGLPEGHLCIPPGFPAVTSLVGRFLTLHNEKAEAGSPGSRGVPVGRPGSRQLTGKPFIMLRSEPERDQPLRPVLLETEPSLSATAITSPHPRVRRGWPRESTGRALGTAASGGRTQPGCLPSPPQNPTTMLPTQKRGIKPAGQVTLRGATTPERQGWTVSPGRPAASEQGASG